MPNPTKKLFPVSVQLLAAAAFVMVSACGVPQDTTQSIDTLQSTDMGLGADHAFRARATIADEAGTHVRYDHFYRGVRVLGGDTIVHDGATGTKTTGSLMSDIRINTNAALTARDALAFAQADLKPRGPYASNPAAELVVVPNVREQVIAKPMRGPGGELTATDIEQVIDGYTLAYYVHTELENGAAETAHTDYLIDARSGSILQKWDSLRTAAANGTGNSEYSGTVTIGTNSITGGWELRDVARGMNFATYNLNHGTSGTGTIFTDTDNTWGDGQDYIPGGSTTNANGQTAGVDAHYGVAKTYDYFKNVHGRNGIDGAGTATYSRVHYSSNYDNAFWSDSCYCMTYGDGNSFNVLTSLDVAGHEMTHGVTSRTANLTYSGESGGLNESMSDIHGTMVEFYAKGGGTTTVPATGGNWLIGDQLSATPLRYMYKPSKDGSSPDAWYSGVGNLDVHYSSGPMNRAFYFLSQGSSSTAGDYYSSYLPGGMTGVGNDHAARLAFKAEVSYMTSSTNYAAARTAFLNAATALYGGTSADYAAVENAFAAINVGAPHGGGGGGTVTTLTDGVGLGSQAGSTGASAFYKITVPAGQTSLVVNTTGGTGDADLYVKFGAQPSTTTYDYSSTGSTTVETITISNPAAGDWYITLYAYSTYSGVTIKGDYSTTTGGDPYLTNGVAVTNISGASGSQQYWRLAVPAGTTQVVFTISGGTGDADMYVRQGARPTTTTYNCRPYLSGNNETCTIANPAAGDWYVMLRGYSAFSGVSLKGQY